MNLIESVEEVKNVTFNSGDSVIMEVKTKRVYKEDKRPFSMVGPINYKGNTRPMKDIIDRLAQVKQSAINLFQDLKNDRNPQDNTVVMDYWKELTPNEKRNIKLRCTELKKAGLLLKVKHLENYNKPKPYTYQINPYMIKPEEYGKACRLWKLLGGSVN